MGPQKTVKALSNEQEEAIRNLIREEVRRVRNTQGRGREGAVDHEEFPAPEVYIARVPKAGIPALDENVYQLTGTGTGTTYGDDEPGFADCVIYHRRTTDTATEPGTLRPIDGETKRVYNFNPIKIPGWSWITVGRDKFDTWWVLGILRTSTETVAMVEFTSTSLTGDTYPGKLLTGKEGTGDTVRLYAPDLRYDTNPAMVVGENYIGINTGLTELVAGIPQPIYSVPTQNILVNGPVGTAGEYEYRVAKVIAFNGGVVDSGFDATTAAGEYVGIWVRDASDTKSGKWTTGAQNLAGDKLHKDTFTTKELKVDGTPLAASGYGIRIFADAATNRVFIRQQTTAGTPGIEFQDDFTYAGESLISISNPDHLELSASVEMKLTSSDDMVLTTAGDLWLQNATRKQDLGGGTILTFMTTNVTLNKSGGGTAQLFFWGGLLYNIIHA